MEDRKKLGILLVVVIIVASITITSLIAYQNHRKKEEPDIILVKRQAILGPKYQNCVVEIHEGEVICINKPNIQVSGIDGKVIAVFYGGENREEDVGTFFALTAEGIIYINTNQVQEEKIHMQRVTSNYQFVDITDDTTQFGNFPIGRTKEGKYILIEVETYTATEIYRNPVYQQVGNKISHFFYDIERECYSIYVEMVDFYLPIVSPDGNRYSQLKKIAFDVQGEKQIAYLLTKEDDVVQVLEEEIEMEGLSYESTVVARAISTTKKVVDIILEDENLKLIYEDGTFDIQRGKWILEILE